MTDPADEPNFEELHTQCRAAGIDLLTGKGWDGSPCFLVCRFGMFLEMPTLRAVADWLEATGQGRAKT